MISIPEILLIDDDPRELDKLKRIIAAFYAEEQKIVLPANNLRQFRSASTALERFSDKGAPDIVFLDIIMPDMSGVQFAEHIRAGGFRGYIVLQTSVNDFASESYMVGAFSYLLKPLKKEQLFSTLRNIENDRTKVQLEDVASLIIRTKQYSRSILLREIVFAEIMGRKLSIHFGNNEMISLNKPMKEIAGELLADGRFCRCHNSIIVNMDKIENLRDNDAVMKTKAVVPISRRYREFKSRYIAYLLHKSGAVKC